MTDLSIVSIETTILDVPLVRPHKFATTSMTAQPLLLVAIRTSDGVIGYGEGVVPGGPWWGGESVETMQVIIEKYIAPVVVGRRVDHITAIMADIEKVVANARFAKAAVDVALHDAWRVAGSPRAHAPRRGFPRECRRHVGTGCCAGGRDHRGSSRKARIPAQFQLQTQDGSTRSSSRRRAHRQHRAGAGRYAGVRVDVNARWDRFTALRYLPQLAEVESN